METSLIDFIPQVADAMFFMVTLFLPFILGNLLLSTWIRYRRQAFFNKQSPVLLEVMLPKEITKTPSAMELFLLNLNQTGAEGTWYSRKWQGRTRPWYSLEMVSLEGKVHFYLWTWNYWKKFLESQIYAQYPGAEVTEVKDYTKQLSFNPETHNVWGCEMGLSKADAYPIKTYRDYGIGDDKVIEEEVKVDPITPMIEYLGMIGQKQQVWIQFICRAHKSENSIPFSDRLADFNEKFWSGQIIEAWSELWKKKDNWKTEAKKEIKELRDSATPVIVNADGTESPGFPNITKGLMEKINALERSIAKPGFDVGIRALYVGEKDYFDATNIGGLTSVFKQYGSHDLNGFAVKNSTSFDFPWQDFFGTKLLKKKRKLIEAYKSRGYFYPPYNKKKHMVLNSEELATIYHFPGQVSQTPSFERVVSKKAEPPGNLPI